MLLFQVLASTFAGAALAAPWSLEKQAVSSEVLGRLTLFAEYSAAAYCTSNLNSSGTRVSCAAGNCPAVESASTTTLDEFDEVLSFGDVAGFTAVDSTNKVIVVSFRGSRTLSTWLADLVFDQVNASSICVGCEVHSGFWGSWQTVASDVTAQVESAVARYPGFSVVFTGHSFGAAVATLGAAVLRHSGHKIELYTYGCPRVGNKALATFITAQSPNYRVTHTNDVVPKVPPRLFGFSHPSPEYWIRSGDSAAVSASDISVVEGIDSTAGNTGAAGASADAHAWYIVNIDKCSSTPTSVSRFCYASSETIIRLHCLAPLGVRT
ncbi:hypothetical protein ASPZODRAFT_18775 [Penicilliopsis zonata CBS 506.65]|uniref:Fungal lipase-like domain-containing protein n=1 Tax=Penicilliopsis zonata CBS 506.65 TaxID=1073090 RepID=A0A1L9S9Z8_9EURO|nr:hypothetical protein ASPZODRAFT_18775 [Penicilliopsis zonata CBS 506.65]OJJ44000.1 hypothetical protein ASPZODRAFT_18775 [Penicilliopsis zonata CBS 506.65]